MTRDWPRDRATHHLVSANTDSGLTLRQWFLRHGNPPHERSREDHRASTDTNLVASTARLLPKRTVSSTGHHLRRTVQYGLKQNPAADKEWHSTSGPSASHGKIYPAVIWLVHGKVRNNWLKPLSQTKDSCGKFSTGIQENEAVSIKLLIHFISDYGNGLFL